MYYRAAATAHTEHPDGEAARQGDGRVLGDQNVALHAESPQARRKEEEDLLLYLEWKNRHQVTAVALATVHHDWDWVGAGQPRTDHGGDRSAHAPAALHQLYVATAAGPAPRSAALTPNTHLGTVSFIIPPTFGGIFHEGGRGVRPINRR